MMSLLSIIAPVFILVGAGYGMVRTGIFKLSVAEALVAFATRLAVPCLLFRAISQLDLGAIYTPNLFLSFYIPAAICFGLGIAGARLLFKRNSPDAVSIGFASLFSNCFLLGIPIMERAFGPTSTDPNFAIISVHMIFCMSLGTIAMEVARSGGEGMGRTVLSIIRAMATNPMVVGAMLGFVANLSGLTLPGVLADPVWLLADTALPLALFSMGGLMNKWALRRSVGAASMVTCISLIVHPLLVLILGTFVFPLPPAFLASAVVTASMPTGVNAYIFASHYDRATGAAASSVLLATAVSVVTISIWLFVLKGQGLGSNFSATPLLQ
ncbi:MAG: AEC family transporter [Pseudomonadota bacterium]